MLCWTVIIYSLLQLLLLFKIFDFWTLDTTIKWMPIILIEGQNYILFFMGTFDGNFEYFIISCSKKYDVSPKSIRPYNFITGIKIRRTAGVLWGRVCFPPPYNMLVTKNQPNYYAWESEGIGSDPRRYRFSGEMAERRELR